MCDEYGMERVLNGPFLLWPLVSLPHPAVKIEVIFISREIEGESRFVNNSLRKEQGKSTVKNKYSSGFFYIYFKKTSKENSCVSLNITVCGKLFGQVIRG